MDSSGNVYLAGTTSSFGAGSYDLVLVKYNGMGVQQWNCTWGGVSGDGCFGVAVDILGKVYLGGTTYSFGVGGADLVLVKYSYLGRYPSDEGINIMIAITVVLIAIVVGGSIAIIYLFRKRRE